MTIYVTLKSQRVRGKPLAKVETALPPLGTVLNGEKVPQARGWGGTRDNRAPLR